MMDNSRKTEVGIEVEAAVEYLGDIDHYESFAKTLKDPRPYAETLTAPLRKLGKHDRETALMIYAAQNARDCWTFVMLPDSSAASEYEARFRAAFQDYFPVTRPESDRKPGPRKVTIGTYEAFAAIGPRLERNLSKAKGFKVLGIAIDPDPGFTPGSAPLGFTRYCTRLIEV